MNREKWKIFDQLRREEKFSTKGEKWNIEGRPIEHSVIKADAFPIEVSHRTFIKV